MVSALAHYKIIEKILGEMIGASAEYANKPTDTLVEAAESLLKDKRFDDLQHRSAAVCLCFSALVLGAALLEE